MIKKWGICCKDNGIFKSQSIQNLETVSGMLTPSDNPSIFVKELEEHHLSFQKWIKVSIAIIQEV